MNYIYELYIYIWIIYIYIYTYIYVYMYEWVGVLHHFNFIGGSLAEKCKKESNHHECNRIENALSDR